MIDYKAVLADLEQQREDLDRAIEGIRKIANKQSNTLSNSPTNQPTDSTKYTNLSVRWAILSLLSESDRALGTGEITQELIKGGIRQGGNRFNSNVSAVLSTMNKNGEVESVEGLYVLTQLGKDKWATIKLSQRYLNRFSVSTES